MSVYFVTCREANAVKIGSSGDPRLRLKEIQWGCPLEVTLEAILPGAAEDEHAFHARFADDRIRLEWFSLTPMIEAIIAANPLPAEEEKPASNQYYREPRSNTLAAQVRATLQITRVELARRLDIKRDHCRALEYGYGKWRNPPQEIEDRLLSMIDKAA